MAAAAVVSVSMGVMKPVLAKLATLMGDEYKKLKGLRKEVTFLQRELSDMDALLEKMDSADELDPQAKNWRKDIIDMSYNIEDCIDDFMQCVGEANNKLGILRKASQYMRTLKDRRRLANQFQEIKTQVMEASERRKRYMLDQCISITTPIALDPRLSALYKESASLVGIEAKKDELVNWATDKRQQLKVMAIVGFGGLGKTTLANEVYHEVGGNFDCKAFVSVSQKPEIFGLFNSLLSQFGLGTYSHACQVQDLINNLRGHLQDKRYLIVVDDLWDIRVWNTIYCAFPQNSKPSRVVITTRNEDVASTCCGNHGFIYMMKPLSEPDSRKLFFGRIFGSEDACPSELSEASYEILRKCGGLPLAIVTMAGMLACQPTRLEGQWAYINNSLSYKFAANTDYEDMMYILDLSYKNLPRHLKACFLYLGSYPEDHEISRVELVRRWVAEGFVSNCTGQDVWDVAESYFNELVNRSMIQPKYLEYENMVPSKCRVHDMVLELIVRRCKEDNFVSLVNDDPQAMAEAQDKVIRRLTVVGSRGGTEDGKVDMITVGSRSQIRSLTILGGSNWKPPFLELKYVRILDICYWHNEMRMDLSGINQLLQLRYLQIIGNGENLVLPGQIRGLRHLETLNLSGIWSQNILLEIVDVPRLSHLIMPGGTRLPERIGEVKLLRTLSGCSLQMDSLESIRTLGELTALSYLNVSFAGPKPKATWTTTLSTCLSKLDNLKLLILGPYNRAGKSVSLCGDMLSSLSLPSCNLKQLYMAHGCTFSKVPRWISHLRNLRELWIGVKQILEEDVAIIGTRLIFLIYLNIRIPGVPTDKIVVGGSTGFPVLEQFKFNCDRISNLIFEEGAMPELRKLDLIFNAQEWDKAAPGGLQYLPSLEKITAWRAYYQGKRLRSDKGVADAALITRVFQEAADSVPTHPTFTFRQNVLSFRHIEEEEDFEEPEEQVQALHI